MNLYHISQTSVRGYDTYSDAVVCAPDEETARLTHPSGRPSVWRYSASNEEYRWVEDTAFYGFFSHSNDWSAPEEVKVKLIGQAVSDLPAGVVCGSFHAG